MERKFILTCESTVDLPFAYVDGRDIPVLFYTYNVGDTEYVDDMCRDPQALPAFYEMLKGDTLPTTSQINEYRYEQFLEEQLQKGFDVMHIAFGTGMTASVNNAYAAAEILKEKYPDRKLIVIDSLCSSSGYGMLVDYAADMRDEGASIEEVEEWVMAHRQRIHHQFYSTDLSFYRRSGRMSGAAATIGAVLNICPIMRLDDGGRIIAYDKMRGKKNAIAETIRTMEAHVQDGLEYSGKCYLCHSNCLPEAEETRAAVLARFPNIKEAQICNIGTIIAGHCGPGTVASFFIGDERLPDKK